MMQYKSVSSEMRRLLRVVKIQQTEVKFTTVCLFCTLSFVSLVYINMNTPIHSYAVMTVLYSFFRSATGHDKIIFPLLVVSLGAEYPLALYTRLDFDRNTATTQ